MKIIDSHCHPELSLYKEDRNAMLERNLEKGVFMIGIGNDYESSKEMAELADKYRNIWATVGLHPTLPITGHDVQSYELLSKREKVVAIGEVGLDYYPEIDEDEVGRQHKVLNDFINLSMILNKPLVLHVRNSKSGRSAHDDVIKILSKFGTDKIHGVVHSFTGTVEESRKYIDMGFFIGLNGIITFSDEYDDLITNIPNEKILLETDSPWLTPVPFRGKRNEPMYVIEVVKKISEIKIIDLENAINICNSNCQKLFKIMI